jgi:hypothetical protein
MKKMLSDFNEEEEDEDESDRSPSPAPKYKTKNRKQIEFYELLRNISKSVRTHSGTTNSDESDSETDSDSSLKSRSCLSPDSSSDGYPSPKRQPPVKTVKNKK